MTINFAVEAGELSRALSLIKGCIPPRSTMPILACVVLRANAGKLAIFGSSGDMEAEIEIGADVGQDGVVAVHGGVLAEVAKSFPKTQSVSVVPGKGEGLLRLASGRARFDLNCVDPELMPAMEIGAGAEIRVKSERLTWLLGIAGPCAADNGENRRQIAGVNLEADGTKLHAIGYDDKRGAIVEIDLEGEAPSGVPRITIPNYAVGQVVRMCKEASEVVLNVRERSLSVLAGGAAFRTRLVDAPYEAVQRSWRPKLEPVFRVRADLLAEAAERLSAAYAQFPLASVVRAVGVQLGEGELRVIAGGARGVSEATDSVEAEILGAVPEINLVIPHLVLGLGVFGNKTVLVHQDGVGMPVQVTSDDVPGVRYLLAPMTRR